MPLAWGGCRALGGGPQVSAPGMKHFLTPVLLTLTFSSGCTLARDSAADAYAKAACNQERRCDRGSYDLAYDNMGECRGDVSDVYEGLMDLAEAFGCEYDPREARRFLGDLKSASCAEYEAGLDTDTIFNCPG